MQRVNNHAAPLQPILVVLVWRGGERFRRALESIKDAERFFSRVLISVTCTPDSPDLVLANAFREESAERGFGGKVEVICTESELPTMRHQKFWIDHLIRTGTDLNEWIYWLAYDDALNISGIQSCLDNNGSWPLKDHTSYFGPWRIRHETPDVVLEEDPLEAAEVWTAFENAKGHSAKFRNWLYQQIRRPTYIQMSGSVAQLAAHARLVNRVPKKRGPMRIELATASYSPIVAEFSSPVVTIYGRSNSDRSQYAKTTRREDVQLLLLMMINPPIEIVAVGLYLVAYSQRKLLKLLGKKLPDEEWRLFSD